MTAFSTLLTGLAGSVCSTTAGVAAGTVTVIRRTAGARDSAGRPAMTTVSTTASVPAVKARRLVTIGGGGEARSVPVMTTVYVINTADLPAGVELDQYSQITDGSDTFGVVKVEKRLAGMALDVAVGEVVRAS